MSDEQPGSTMLQHDPNYVAPIPPPITIDDLVNSLEALKLKEATDKALLEGIGNINSDDLKTKLVSWAIAGFPNVYEIHKVEIRPPAKCSDDVVRGLADYVQFCSGKTINEHVDVLQQKVSGIAVSFANMGTHIAIVVTKA